MTLWISEAEVTEVLQLEDAIDAEEAMLRRQAAGEAKNITKALGQWGEGKSMHSLGSMAPDAGVAGFKTWVNTKHGSGTLFTLFDTETGKVKAVIQSAALSKLRTAAISGLATRWMSRPDAQVMALVGAGKQALLQVAAVAAVRPLRRLKVFSPRAETRTAFLEKAGPLFDFEIETVADLGEATRGADVVTVVTRAREPFVPASVLSAGAHVNAVGAILRGRAELQQDVFDRAGWVVVDDLSNARSISQEFGDRYGTAADADWGAVKELGDVVATGRGRPEGVDLSLFKAMGMGVADLALASIIHDRAVEQGLGREIDSSGRSEPRWRSARPTPAKESAAAD